MIFHVRRLMPKDLSICAQLFYETVHAVNKSDYSIEQLEAWAPNVEEMSSRLKVMLKNNAWVVEEHKKIVGFGDMTNVGYIDRLYVHKDYQRKGIARLIFEKWLAFAKAKGLKELTTDASITAKPAAEALGFKVVQKQLVEKYQQAFINYKMVYRVC